MLIWINAGELSGDMHGQALLKALRARKPGIMAVGMGGMYLDNAGMLTLQRVEDLSVMGATEVLTALPRALRMLDAIRKELSSLKAAGKIDAVVLIDAPDFNFRVAKIAAGLDIPVYYYIPPKVWAWRTGRVHFLERYVRKIFCILPFEPAFYQSHGLSPEQISFVGNPLVDMVNWAELQHIEPLPRRVGIMPGSRRAEVHSLMPLFGATARLLRTARPDLEFCCLRAPNVAESTLRALWPQDIPLTMLEPETRYQAMRSCACILAASGTATLETALAGTPTLLAYRVSNITYTLGKRVIKVPWVGLPNLILNREVFPECLQQDANPEHMASIVGTWLDEPDRLEAVRAELGRIRELCGPPGSTGRAAELLLQALENSAVPPCHS